MDSRALLSNPITHDVEIQIAKIYNPLPTKSSIRVEIASVQQQEDIHECGLFAVAYAVEVCYSRKPESAHFEQHLMRQHLKKCLNEEHFEPFPKATCAETLPRPTRRIRNIKLYCLCHMPECFDNRMILCDHCNHWYHCSCVLSGNAVPDTWMCLKCLQQ